jgi:hypothetical protein
MLSCNGTRSIRIGQAIEGGDVLKVNFKLYFAENIG